MRMRFGVISSLIAAAGAITFLTGGCPLIGITNGSLNVSISATYGVGDTFTAGATVDKVQTLTADISGGSSPYTVSWEQIAGPPAAVSSETSASTTVTPKAAGIYAYRVNVRDDNGVRDSADVEFVVGDIQFTVEDSDAVVPGNPATIILLDREGDENATGGGNFKRFNARTSVFDPEFTRDQRTQMTVTYDIVGIPDDARDQDVSLDRQFDSISNQGTGDVDGSLAVGPSLDAVVGVTIRANPDNAFSTLSNIATLVSTAGQVVPGDYSLRVTVTNPDGVQRSRDLAVTLLVEGINGPAGFDGRSAGPATLAVKSLPAAPDNVTDAVLLAGQHTSMTVTVFPSSATSYRFYVRDNNGVAHPEVVSPDEVMLSATGSPQDVNLTIASTDGLPLGTHELWFESFDSFGQITNNRVLVNGATNIEFHVTDDFYANNSINAAEVGSASNDVDTPVDFEGWSATGIAYGTESALVDVNGDGVADIVTLTGAGFGYSDAGFDEGSTGALRHPENDGHFGPGLPALTDSLNTAAAPTQLAAGDLNGDDLPDVAVTFVNGGVGTVQIFFHTGNPAAPYSSATDQTLTILPPEYDRQSLDSSTGVLSGSPFADPGRGTFGNQIAIADVTGDGEADLIITDPAFNQVRVQLVAAPASIAPPSINDFQEGDQGRAYVFAGGASGRLLPGRPQLITSLVTERLIQDGTAPNEFTAPVLSTSFAEANTTYTNAYIGNPFDNLGRSLATGNGFAVGSFTGAGGGSKRGAVDIVNPVSDGETITVTVSQPTSFGAPTITQVTMVCEFDTTANGGVDGLVNVAVANQQTVIEVELGTDNSASNARARLVAAINAAATGDRLVDAVQDTAVAERVILNYRFGAADGDTRNIDVADTMVGVGNDVVDLGSGAGTFVQNNDGVVYRVASGAASGVLANAILGTTNSNMGIGWRLALGKINGSTVDDLVISALDSGAAAGTTLDGAVFLLLDGSNSFSAAVQANVGANTARSGGVGGANLTPTLVGDAVAVGDVNGDGLDEVFFTEPGFDHIYMHRGAASPSATPNLTVSGVNFDNSLDNTPGNGTGTFLFGDINGDGNADWVFIDTSRVFGFAGVQR